MQDPNFEGEDFEGFAPKDVPQGIVDESGQAELEASEEEELEDFMTPDENDDERSVDEKLRDMGKAAVAAAGMVCTKQSCIDEGRLGAHIAHPEEGWL